MIDGKLYFEKIKDFKQIIQEEANYDFIKMPITILLKNNEELKKDLQKIQDEYNTLKGKTNKDIWREELDVLSDEYVKYLNEYYKYMDFDKKDFQVKKPK